MRYFFRRRIPQFHRALLVESGSRKLAEDLMPLMRGYYGDKLAIDLITCYAGLPKGFPPEPATRVFRVGEYGGRAGRRRLYAELEALGYPVLGVICSGEPIMTKWKWALAARLPVKIFVLNENGDYFWLDYSNWRIIIRFVLERAGLSGPGAVRTILRAALFPVTLLYLMAYAAGAHLKRGLRRGVGIMRES